MSDPTSISADTPASVRLFGVEPDSIVDGPGLRYAIFVQGCSHACPGCHNPDSHPTQGGKCYSIDSLIADIESNGLVHDVTLSGGDPFEQPEACAEIARRVKALGYGLWTYTGYLFEDLLRRSEEEPAVGELLACTDVLVDGPFIQSLKSLDLQWRGSSNQRIIDVSASMEATKNAGNGTDEVVTVLWSKPEFAFPDEAPSW